MSRAGSAEGSFAETLDAAQAGSGPALRTLYERYAPAVQGYLRARGAAEPEDLTSEVFLGVLPRLGRFRGDEAHFRSFVFTVAHARLVDDLRRRSRGPQLAEYLPGTDTRSVPSAEDDALTAAGTRQVLARLSGLAVDQREVLTLRVVGDLTVEQVAAVLGKSVGAVKQLQRRGLATLRRVGPDDGEH